MDGTRSGDAEVPCHSRGPEKVAQTKGAMVRWGKLCQRVVGEQVEEDSSMGLLWKEESKAKCIAFMCGQGDCPIFVLTRVEVLVEIIEEVTSQQDNVASMFEPSFQGLEFIKWNRAWVQDVPDVLRPCNAFDVGTA